MWDDKKQWANLVVVLNEIEHDISCIIAIVKSLWLVYIIERREDLFCWSMIDVKQVD